MGVARGLTRRGPKSGLANAWAEWPERASALGNRRSVTISENTLIELLRHDGEMTKSDLAVQTDFSRTKVTTCIDSLVYKKILVANDSTEYSGGRRSKSFRLNEKLGLVAGIQMGAIDFDLGLADFSGKLLAQRSEPAMVKDGPIPTLGHACSALEKMLAELGMRPELVVGIGIGVPGPVDFAARTVVSPPIMPGWDRYPIVETCPTVVPAGQCGR